MLVRPGGGGASTVNGKAPLVPPLVVSVKSRAPTAALDAIESVAVAAEGLSMLRPWTVMSVPALSVMPEAKLVPDNITFTSAPRLPDAGVIPLNVGGGGTIVKVFGPLVPALVVTVTLC
jgi:hypothetical protein